MYFASIMPANLDLVFGEIDPARRISAIRGIYAERGVPRAGSTVADAENGRMLAIANPDGAADVIPKASEALK